MLYLKKIVPILCKLFLLNFWLLYDVNHGYRHFSFGIEVEQTDTILLFSSIHTFRKNPVFLEEESIKKVLRF